MKHDVEEFLVACDICQQSKTLLWSQTGLLQLLPIPKQVWDDISLHFIERLPHSKGYDMMFVIIDLLSKYAHGTINAWNIYERGGVSPWFSSFDCFRHDKIFLSLFWTELSKLEAPHSSVAQPIIYRRMGKQRWGIGALKHIYVVYHQTTKIMGPLVVSV